MKLFWIIIVSTWGFNCSPLPAPKPIPPTTIITPDTFAQYRADCSDVSISEQQEQATLSVQHCCDGYSPIDACMVAVADSLTRDVIICSLVSLNMAWQHDIAMKTATSQVQAAAGRANKWIFDHQIGVRR
jgi:hypothetical protein